MLLSKRILIINLILFSSITNAMVFDNKYLPLYLKPFTRRIGSLGHFRLQPFFMRSDRGQGDLEDLTLPDIDGRYNQVEIAKVLVQSGCLDQNPFRTDLQGISTIDWTREGRIDVQGLAFLYEHEFPCNISAGINILMMHISSNHEFCLNGNNFNLMAGDREYLFNLKDFLNNKLCLTPPVFSRIGFGDTDFYLRWGMIWDYILKFRRIDAGIRIGGLAPTATPISINNPAAIPFGGTVAKNWGAYIQLDSEFELKEDWSFGLMLRASKRFPNTQNLRIPLGFEPTNYGALTGPVRLNPGWTFVFNPYIVFEGLREGLGVKALYTLVGHLEDRLTDMRNDKTVEANLAPVERRSSWGMEHVTICAFYDTSKFKDCRSWYLPTVSLYWDIPVDWLVAKKSAKTTSVSLMVETDF